MCLAPEFYSRGLVGIWWAVGVKPKRNTCLKAEALYEGYDSETLAIPFFRWIWMTHPPSVYPRFVQTEKFEIPPDAYTYFRLTLYEWNEDSSFGILLMFTVQHFMVCYDDIVSAKIRKRCLICLMQQ